MLSPGTLHPGFFGTRENGGADDVDFKLRLAAFPALLDRLTGAAVASELRGAGPMRQDVRRRVHGRVLLVATRPAMWTRSPARDSASASPRPTPWRPASPPTARPTTSAPGAALSAPAWRFTAGLLWSRNQPLLGPRLVPSRNASPGSSRPWSTT